MMSRGTITVSKYDAEEYSFILRSANVSYSALTEDKFVNFYVEEDESKINWLKKLADDLHIGIISVPFPSEEDRDTFMNVLENLSLHIAGTKHTWLFGCQYIIKGHEGNLAVLQRYLRSQKKLFSKS